MKSHFGAVLRDFLIISLVALVIVWGASLYFYFNTVAVLTAYLLSFFFVGSNFWIIKKMKKEDESSFYKHFFVSLGVRFLLVIAALILILKSTKIHEIYFTVSFIISYILHSVIEIISINKILETDN